jgi:transcriptional regulator with XRE-family HTH domain
MGQRRRQLGITQESLAEKLGVVHESVSKMEQGSIAPKFDRLPAIAAALNCSIPDLFRLPDGSAEEMAATYADIVNALPREEQKWVLDTVIHLVKMLNKKHT